MGFNSPLQPPHSAVNGRNLRLSEIKGSSERERERERKTERAIERERERRREEGGRERRTMITCLRDPVLLLSLLCLLSPLLQHSFRLLRKHQTYNWNNLSTSTPGVCYNGLHASHTARPRRQMHSARQGILHSESPLAHKTTGGRQSPCHRLSCHLHLLHLMQCKL